MLENLSLLVFPKISKFFFKIGRRYFPNELSSNTEILKASVIKLLSITTR